MEAKSTSKIGQVFYARLASVGQLGLVSDPLMVSKFHNRIHDPKGQANKIFNIVMVRETFYSAAVKSILDLKRLYYKQTKQLKKSTVIDCS